MENNDAGIFSALDLAYYVATKYESKYGREISPIKLQKSLYFLFAEWGSFVEKSRREALKDEENRRIEQDLSNFSRFLFDDKIEAWVYGPVIPKVYFNFENYKIIVEKEKVYEKIEKNLILKEFIDGLLADLFECSDFHLVDLAHEDEPWKNNFNDYDDVHSEEISKESIINYYVSN